MSNENTKPTYNGREVTQPVRIGHYNETCAYCHALLFSGERALQSNDGRYLCSLRCADLANVTNWWDL